MKALQERLKVCTCVPLSNRFFCLAIRVHQSVHSINERILAAGMAKKQDSTVDNVLR